MIANLVRNLNHPHKTCIKSHHVRLLFSGFNSIQSISQLPHKNAIAIRIITPILIMFLISLAGRPDSSQRVDRFYAKMRTRVQGDPQTDAQELALSLADVRRHDNMLLFPRSGWEFYKWNREDFIGFVAAGALVCALLLLMAFLVKLGG